MLLDPIEPLLIFGDLNMDLRSTKGIDLANFLIRNDLKNFVNEHTRVCRSFYKEKRKYKTSKTLIDVIIHNQNRIIDTKVIGCPFSDRKFLIAALDFGQTKSSPFINVGRSLSEKNLMLILDQIKNKNYYFEKEDLDIDRIWNEYKKKFIRYMFNLFCKKNTRSFFFCFLNFIQTFFKLSVHQYHLLEIKKIK